MSQITGRSRTGGNRRHRIVAQEEVAGSSPVGHPPFWREQKIAGTIASALLLGLIHRSACNRDSPKFVCTILYKPYYRVEVRSLGRPGSAVPPGRTPPGCIPTRRAVGCRSSWAA